MTVDLARFASATSRAKGVGALTSLIEQAIRTLDVEYFALAHHFSTYHSGGRTVLMHNYPESWAATMHVRHYMTDDPVREICKTRRTPFLWSDIPSLIDLSPRQREILSDAKRAGLLHGYTVPIRVPNEPVGSCSFAATREISIATRRTLRSIATIAFNAARRLASPGPMSAPRRSARPEKDLELLRQSILKSAGQSPRFSQSRGYIRYQPAKPSKAIAERKRVAVERCIDLIEACKARANEQPHLQALADRYYAALKTLTSRRGVYSVLISGLEIESVTRIKARAPADSDRNPAIDADLLLKIEALVIANAGLMALFPDARQTTDEVDRYRENTDAMDALRNRVIEPVLRSLADSEGLLDEETKNLTDRISNLNIAQPATEQSKGVVSIKHGWLRGSLASIGNYLLGHLRKLPDSVRDSLVSEAISAGLKHPVTLTSAAIAFLVGAKAALVSLATALPEAFGWILSLLAWLGLG